MVNKEQCEGQIDLLDYMNNNFEIFDCCIGYGRNNATKRENLPGLFDEKGDREAREKIRLLRVAGFVIINDARGSGYYRPKKEDYPYVLAHRNKERKRAQEILDALEAEEIWLEENSQWQTEIT